jgi:LmbE family N-acetylglucosaminyl deacetylase
MTRNDVTAAALERSVLIVAHPDDEILWFGSVASRVDRIVVCFLNDPANPDLKEARRRALRDHPLHDRITCLGLDETGAFGLADWPVPDVTEFGLQIDNDSDVADAYQARFVQVRELLAPIVQSAANLITHNPWGEYGHEEHVLVSRAVSVLADRYEKPVWYNNYASTWSEHLMCRYLDRSNRRIFRGRLIDGLLEEVAGVYRTHGAWTWFDDYTGFEEEFFVQGPLTRSDQPGFGWLFPVNLLRLPERKQSDRPPPPSIIQRISRRLKR